MERFGTRKSHQTVAFLTRGCEFLIQGNAEFLAEHRFDAFEIFLHEDKLLLDVRKALQEFIQSFGQLIQTLCEAFFHLLKTFVDGSQESDVLCDELFLQPFVLNDKTFINPSVLSGELCVQRFEDGRSLLRQQVLDLRKYGGLFFFGGF